MQPPTRAPPQGSGEEDKVEVGALRNWPSFLIVSASTSSWEFDRNKQRENIMKPGVTEVFSDTFGLVRRRDGPVKLCVILNGNVSELGDA